MSARALPLLVTGLALLIAGCSGGSGTSGTASNGAAPAAGSATAETEEAKPSTKKEGDDAVGRYATFLHAIGNEDVATACEIGGDTTKKLEADLGPCEKQMQLTVEMYSPTEKAAMQGATVDRSAVDESSTRVEIPVSAVKVGADLTDTELPDAIMEQRDVKWYLVKWSM
ncbi:hypothetical protein [Amycolatopsis sp. NBC_01480]|jgi:hypothetical protein|uniref:hypothetical protein n=1 Tax=Amycolatopsis sp. NBC_01480 TaxID=2903562 RepID=UPI002E2866E9|nr:hypothetical protein [Amycolatopsis sp. NBC_01480]